MDPRRPARRGVHTGERLTRYSAAVSRSTLCGVPPEEGRSPVYPIYLDTPMLMSFFATMQDGYYLTSSVSRKAARSRKRRGKFAGEAGLGNIASLLGLKTSVSGQYERDSEIASDVVETFVRENTAASMFNRLYDAFDARQLIKRVLVADALYSMRPSDIVEIRGIVKENPIEYLFDSLTKVLPTALFLQAFQRSLTNQQPGLPAAELNTLDNEMTPALLERLREDITGGPVTDIVLEGDFCRAVVTASRAFLTESARATLVGGSFTTIGKVVMIGSTSEDAISVVRRGGLAAFSQIQTMFGSLIEANKDKFAIDISESEIKGPYLQIVPLAIFI